MIPRPVELTWLDSMFMRTGWTDFVDPHDITDLRCYTIGYLVGETSLAYVVANSVTRGDGDNWHHTDSIAIPKRAVVRRKLGKPLR